MRIFLGAGLLVLVSGGLAIVQFNWTARIATLEQQQHDAAFGQEAARLAQAVRLHLGEVSIWAQAREQGLTHSAPPAGVLSVRRAASGCRPGLDPHSPRLHIVLPPAGPWPPASPSLEPCLSVALDLPAVLAAGIRHAGPLQLGDPELALPAAPLPASATSLPIWVELPNPPLLPAPPRTALRILSTSTPDSNNWRLIHRPRARPLAGAIASSRWRDGLLAAAIQVCLFAAWILLWRAARRAERISRQQAWFAASLSHELRTPLAAIGALARNQEDGLVSQPLQVREYGALIGRELQRLRQLYENSLVLARQDPDPSRQSRFNLAALVEECGGRLPYSPPPIISVGRTDLYVTGNRELFAHALDNALWNAYQHGRPPVEIRCAAGWREAILEIQDSGPGLAPGDRQRAFQPFWRGRSRRHPGSGLGLSVIQRVAELHGGQACFADPGNTLVLRVPLSRTHE
jgi:signal transduction histidine kinase